MILTTTCNIPLGPYAHHSTTCGTGPERTRRHNQVVQALAKWLKDHGHAVQTEVHVPQLDQPQPDGTNHTAILDIVAQTPEHTHYIDVSITSPLTHDLVTHDTAPPNANPTRRRELDKRRKYGNHPNLVPFTLNTHGQLGQEAIHFLRHTAPTDIEQRTQSLTDIYYTISTTLQHGNAECIAAAQPPSPNPKQITPKPPDKPKYNTHPTLTTQATTVTTQAASSTSIDVRPNAIAHTDMDVDTQHHSATSDVDMET